jgi:hypothetical protein
VAPFSLHTNPPARAIPAANLATYAIQIEHTQGFTYPVTLEIGSSPSSDLEIDLSPSAVFDPPGGEATLTLTDLHDKSFSSSLGYRIPITATGGGFTQTASVVLLINPKSTYLPLIIR